MSRHNGSPKSDHDTAITRSWAKNATAWAQAVRTGRIGSRVITDAAILEIVRRLQPRRILDAGCGEGWLSSALAETGHEVEGFDASRELTDIAREAHPGIAFHTRTYQDLTEALPTFKGRFNAVVCNFSLFAEDLVPILATLKACLAPDGHLIIQTLNPETQSAPYTEGWRIEDFSAFAAGDWSPMPWYFRTRVSWLACLDGAGFDFIASEEPRASPASAPSSLILIASPAMDQAAAP